MDTEKINLLFVDDEPDLLRGLKRALRPKRHAWNVKTAVGAEAALRMLADSPFDVIVSDMRMPEIDGAELLRRARDLQPHLIRLVLTGEASRDALVRCASVAHQVLWKPCNVDVLSRVIERATRLRASVNAFDISQRVAAMEHLPDVPATYQRLVQSLERGNTGSKEIARTLEQAPGVCAKVMQVASSALFFGASVQSAQQAVDILGIETLRAVTLQHDLDVSLPNANEKAVAQLWRHSERVAASARRIATALGLDRSQCDLAFVTGLLHDVGAAIALSGNPCPPDLHPLLGAYLLGLWGLPDEVVAGVAWHRSPSAAPADDRELVLCVHLADALDAGTPLDDESLLSEWDAARIERARASVRNAAEVGS